MQKAQEFFEKRFSKENPAASVMLRSGNDNVAEKRDTNEAIRIKKLIDFTRPQRVFDIGCGYGRLAFHFQDEIELYEGIDSSAASIDCANELFKEKENIKFHTMLADNLDTNLLAKDYTTVFLTGLFVYLNDDAVDEVLKNLPTLVSQNALLYCRESVSVIEERLTLKDFPSEELQSEYNAIYRTPKEYEKLFATCLPNAKILSTSLILDESTGARKETNQQYWLIQL